MATQIRLCTYPSECYRQSTTRSIIARIMFLVISRRLARLPIYTPLIRRFCFFSIEGEYVPLPGDHVRYRLCPIPPKLEKCQAVHVEIINLTPQVHLKWDSPENN